MSLDKIEIKVIDSPKHVVICPVTECKTNDQSGVCLSGPSLVIEGGYQAMRAVEEGYCPQLVCDICEIREEFREGTGTGEVG